MVTNDGLDTWEGDERAKDTPDPRVLALIDEVRRLRDLLAESLREGEKLVRLFAKLTKASGEQALEDLRSRDARSALALN